MATEPVPFRLEPELIALLDGEAESAGRRRAAHVAAIVKAHLRGNGNGQSAPSDEFLRRHDQILQVLRTVANESTMLAKAVGHKESETSRDFADLGKQIDQLRSDIATLFAAALQSFAGVERNDAIAFTQKYMYPAAARA
jgi:hypothetical protein